MGCLRVFEAFSGYGSQSIALRNIGVPYEVVAISEIDKYAIKAYEAVHGEVNNLGDIRKIDVNDVPEHDLLTYSFPCTDISVAGKLEGLSKGSNTRSGLLWECERIIEHCKPKYLLMENVKNLVGKKFKPEFDKWCELLESLGYVNYWKILNAKDYGMPQNRERVFMVSIAGPHIPYEFPEPIKLNKSVKDILEEDIDEKYYAKGETFEKVIPGKDSENLPTIEESPAMKNDPIMQQVALTFIDYDYRNPQTVLIPQATKKGYIELKLPGIADLSYPNSKTRRGRVQEGGAVSPTITATKQDIWYFEEDFSSEICNYKARRLTSKEYFKIMGMCDEDIDKIQRSGISETRQCKMAGNSIVVQVLEHIFKNLFYK